MVGIMKKTQILWIAHSYATAQEGVKKHMHPYCHMLHIVRGSVRFVVDNKTHILNAGDSILIPKDTNHAFYNDSTEHAEYLEIKFSQVNPYSISLNEKKKVFVTSNELAGGLFKQILKEYSHFDNRAEHAAESYLDALLNLLDEEKRSQANQSFKYIIADDFSELSQNVIRYLEEHYSEPVSLDELANAMDHNKSYLCVAFKKDTQLTILDCLNTIRIRRAAELIVYSEYNLTQVAEACGFASTSHFNRVFLKYVGITPGQCRRAFPADILIYPKDAKKIERTNHFVYSVLAQKLVSPQMIRDLDLPKTE